MTEAPNNPATAAAPAMVMRKVSVPSLHDASACVATDVEWSVVRGEFWVIAGPQRAGKTDFLMMAAGLSAPLQGEYRALDEAMPVFEESRWRERLRVGLVFEGGKLFQHLTVAENVALPLCYHENLSFAEAWPRVEPLLAAMELGPLGDNTPSTLSHDLQSRAGLARALVMQPELLFLDNPLARLDSRAETWWRKFLGELNRGNGLTGGKPLTLVVTTEDLRPWRGCAGRFARLDADGFAVTNGVEESRWS